MEVRVFLAAPKPYINLAYAGFFLIFLHKKIILYIIKASLGRCIYEKEVISISLIRGYANRM